MQEIKEAKEGTRGGLTWGKKERKRRIKRFIVEEGKEGMEEGKEVEEGS